VYIEYDLIWVPQTNAVQVALQRLALKLSGTTTLIVENFKQGEMVVDLRELKRSWPYLSSVSERHWWMTRQVVIQNILCNNKIYWRIYFFWKSPV
jgi:hypothetical protein